VALVVAVAVVALATLGLAYNLLAQPFRVIRQDVRKWRKKPPAR
jgi:hypothetical protein